MRHLAPVFLVLSGLLFAPDAARAEGRKIIIEKVLVGFFNGPDTTRFKAGAWAPVYVYLKNDGQDRINAGEYVLTVETTDSEDVQNHYTERRLLPPLVPGEVSPLLLAYVRPGGENNEITVYVQTADGKTTLDSKKPAPENSEAVPFNAQLVLLVGSKLPGMKRGLIQPAKENKANEIPAEGEQEEDNTLDAKGPLRFVSADKVEQLPTRWFGYAGVDLLVLTTGREEFIKSLIEDQTGRKEALAEWVRRGGRLVLSAGRNQQFVQKFLSQTQLLNCELTGAASRESMDGVRIWAGAPNRFEGTVRKDKPGTRSDVEFTQIVPGAGVDVLARELPSPRDAKQRPVIVQGASGLGRVVLVAFDLDAPPFTSWPGQGEFWKKLGSETDIREVKQEAAGNQPVGGKNAPVRGGRQNVLGSTSGQVELASRLQDSLETFDDVAPISFGWVALFIFIYILIVGPIDYFFLKKIVKRLELTWVTFPAVVLSISAIAYFTAYWLKGNELKINKVDIVDIDLASARAYGSTWVTLYSPRIQNYTVGVEPAPANWNWTTPKSEQAGDSPVMVDWMGRPEADWQRKGQQGLLNWNRPTYRYAEDVAGLEGVPIRVWATKSFASSWKMALSAEQPLFEAELHKIGKDSDQLAGTITSRLPVDLDHVVLLYEGKLFSVKGGRLSRDESHNINYMKLGELGNRGEQLPRWFDESWQTSKKTPTGSASKGNKNGGGMQTEPVGSLVKSLLFHSANSAAASEGNSLLRYLDQSWRVKETHKEEVILLGRVAAEEGAAKDITRKELSPSRLWLGALPGSKEKDLEGTMSQETYIRVYIPLQSKP